MKFGFKFKPAKYTEEECALKPSSKQKQQLTNALIFVFIALMFAMLIYPALHEFGHAVAAVIFGGRVHSIGITAFRAYARISGTFTPYERAVINVSGFAFPYILWFIFIITVPKECPPLVKGLKLYSSVSVIATTLPWIVIPFIYNMGKVPQTDDVTKFLRNSGASPAIVALVFLLIFTVSVVLFLKKIGNIKGIFEQRIL